MAHKQGHLAKQLFVLMAFTVALSSCRMQGKNLSEVEYSEGVKQNIQNYQSGNQQAPNSPRASGDPSSQVSYEGNIEQERLVADGCLQAWRKAVAGDEATAMKMLEELDKEHPGISTVQFMMGQVKDHFKKHKEAAQHYQKGVSVNEFSSMQTYKLAEAMRKSGDAKGSIQYYEKLIANLERATGDYGREHMTQLLASVRLGLAQSYKDLKQNDKALVQVKKALVEDPQNKVAPGLLKELEGAK